MNCTEFDAALELSVETRQPLGTAAAEHALHCHDCRSAWQIHRQLDAAIAAWRPVEVPVSFVDTILAELASPDLTATRPLSVSRDDHKRSLVQVGAGRRISAARVSARQEWSAVFAAAALCLTIAVVLSMQNVKRESGDLAHDARDPLSELPVAEATLDVSRTLTEVFSDLRTEYREMATETTSVAREFASVIPYRVEVPGRPDPEQIKLHPTSGDVGRIWRPIGTRVETALGFIWQAIPTDVPAG